MLDKVDLKGMAPEELEAFISSLGKEKYRTKQLLSWIYGKGVVEIEGMTDLSKAFRKELAEIAQVSALQEAGRISSSDDGTTKFLFELGDGLRIESVLIVEDRRRTVCLSSQVGCPLGCVFCATGQMGFVRNLSAAEIIDQLLAVRRAAGNEGLEITNVVMMGMGEPLLNYANVLKAIRLMRLEMGPSIGARKVTLSTAGFVPGIRKLAREDLRIGLAVSLNATTDRIRGRLMPINRRYNLSELMQGVQEYYRSTRRRPTFEYVLISEETDSDDDAERLGRIVRSVPSKINLIPYNPTRGSPFRQPSQERIERFMDLLLRKQLTVTLRESKGSDISAACGQLYQDISGVPVGPASVRVG